MTPDELAALQALADRADRTPWAFSNETRAAALAIRPLLDALDAETARADVNSRLRQSMEAAGTRYQAERRSALEAAGLYLRRARTAEAERNEARAEVERLRAALEEIDALANRWQPPSLAARAITPISRRALDGAS